MKKRMTAFLLLLLMLCLAFSGCDSGPPEKTPPPPDIAVPPEVIPAPETPPKKVGISLPEKNLRYWERSGTLMRLKLEAKGFAVDLRYAGNDVDIQASQVEDLIESGCELLIITAIDSGASKEHSAFNKALESARDKGLPIISHARLISATDALSYFVTFDYMDAVLAHVKYIEDELNLKNSPGAFNIEIFGGDSSPGNEFSDFSKFFVAYLQTYLDSGKAVIPSGQVEIRDTGIDGYETEAARTRMDELISSQGYGPGGKKLDAVVCASDSIAQGVTQALLGAGYASDNFPIVTGWGCDSKSVKNILNGTQAMSLYSNTNKLAERTVTMAESILKGKKPETNWPEGYHNGVKTVPTYACDFDIVTKKNYLELLVTSRYYTQEEIDIIS